jgi:hypothetical protein
MILRHDEKVTVPKYGPLGWVAWHTSILPVQRPCGHAAVFIEIREGILLRRLPSQTRGYAGTKHEPVGFQNVRDVRTRVHDRAWRIPFIRSKHSTGSWPST